MSVFVPVERPPDMLNGRAPMNILKYTGEDVWLYLLPSDWQAKIGAQAARKVYAARGFPPQGVALQLPNGSWYGVDAPNVDTNDFDLSARANRLVQRVGRRLVVRASTLVEKASTLAKGDATERDGAHALLSALDAATTAAGGAAIVALARVLRLVSAMGDDRVRRA